MRKLFDAINEAKEKESVIKQIALLNSAKYQVFQIQEPLG